jgi:nitroreductase
MGVKQLDALVKAALESPVVRNERSWSFTVVMDKGVLEEINAETISR